MADGQTHALANGIVLATVAAVAPFLLDGPAAAGAIVGATCGLLVTPDQDVNGITYEESRVYRRLGTVAGVLWQGYWYPYALLMSHRHRLSHGPIVGTLLRFAYTWPIWLALALLVAPPLAFWMAMLAAWMLQDTVHLVLDGWKYTR